MSGKIPTTIITGFLGSGKTTLIQNVLRNVKGKRIALVINEFGDLGVDRDFLKGCGDETCSEDDMVELANGCICCTVADEFIPTMSALLDREQRPDHIIIETSGLALPQPLVRAFNWPEIKAESRLTVSSHWWMLQRSQRVDLLVTKMQSMHSAKPTICSITRRLLVNCSKISSWAETWLSSQKLIL